MEGANRDPKTHDRQPVWAWAVFLSVSLALFAAGIGWLPLMDRDEPRFAEASREMLESGDWIVPHLNGQYRFDKPPLIYWLQAGCIVLFGPSEMAVRLPSVLCATLTGLLIALWGRRLAGDRAGLMAGIVWVTCPQAFVHAHLAVADMAMVLGFTLTSWAGWEVHQAGLQGKSATRWIWTFFASLALGFLAKGPVAGLAALPAILLACGRLASPNETPSLWRRPRIWWAGSLGALGLVAIWGIPALWTTRGDYFEVGIGKHVVARSVGVLEGHGLKGLRGYLGSLPFYALTLLVGFLPWSPWLVKSLWRLRSSGPRPTLDRYLAAGIAGVFVVFTLIRTKLPHYTLPAFPLIALWLGKTLAGDPLAPRTFRRCALGSALVLLLVSLPGLGWFGGQLPVPRLAAACSPWITPATEVATLEFQEPSLYWYFRPTGGPWIQHLESELQAQEFLAKPGSRVCVLPQGEVVQRLSARFPDLRTLGAQGFNPANGKRVELRALVRVNP